MKSVIDIAVWNKWRDFEKEEQADGFFCELLEKALMSAPKLMNDLEAAIEQTNVKAVHYCSHTLSSTCKSLGAPDLADKLKAVENESRKTPPVIRKDLLAPILAEFRMFIAEVQHEHDKLKQKAA
jgi:HPt (histidine-containing phosphotransfer) domain-containing protein